MLHLYFYVCAQLPTASDAIGKSTTIIEADSHHRAALTSAHMNRRFDVSCYNLMIFVFELCLDMYLQSNAYIMQW